jgi:NarL family two-component system response regulator LiaR
MKRIRILIADDHLIVRAQVFARLTREPDFEVVALADNSLQAVESALATRPDLILYDPLMNDGMGWDALKHLRAQLPETPVVILTAFTDTAQRIELRKLGIVRILNKGIESRHLIQFLRETADARAVKLSLGEGKQDVRLEA